MSGVINLRTSVLQRCASASSAKVVERKERQSSDRERKKGGMKAGFGERKRETYTDSEKEIKGPW